MDGLEETGAIVMIATNRPSSLDPAIVRDGRMDRRIHVARPTRDESTRIVTTALGRKPLEGDDDAEALAMRIVDAVFSRKFVLAKVFRKSKGELSDKLLLQHTVSGAMLVGIVERATSNAMHRDGAGICASDCDTAVVQAFNESLDVNHEDELLEVLGACLWTCLASLAACRSTLASTRRWPDEATDQAVSPESLRRQIEALSPPDRLRLAAGLMEAQRGELAHTIASAVVDELGAAIALRKLDQRGGTP